MVNEIRVPSSSSSAIIGALEGYQLLQVLCDTRTDCDWLDLDTFLNMRRRWIIGIFVMEDFLAAQGIYKSRPT
jgi:uncharacterized membrane protein